MQGSTHKAIGFAAGAGIVTYAVLTGRPLMAFGIITAPAGAMLPDIDHHNSKLGRTKDKLFSLIKVISLGAMICALVVLAISVILGILNVTASICLSVIGVGLLINITLSDYLAKKFPFLTKHRGIMHTLVLPVIMLLFCNMTKYDIPRSLVFGLAIGYLSHLYADSLTVEGCPLVWPISKECVGPKLCRTGGIMEYIFAGLLAVFCIVYSVMLAKDSGYIILAFMVLIVPAFDVIARMLFTQCSKKSKKLKLAWPVLLCCICIALITAVIIGPVAIKLLAGSGILGMLLGGFNYLKERG